MLITFLLAKGAKIRATNYTAYLGTWLSYHLTYIIIVSYLETLLLLIHFKPLYLIHKIYTQCLRHRVPERGTFTVRKYCIC